MPADTKDYPVSIRINEEEYRMMQGLKGVWRSESTSALFRQCLHEAHLRVLGGAKVPAPLDEKPETARFFMLRVVEQFPKLRFGEFLDRLSDYAGREVWRRLKRAGVVDAGVGWDDAEIRRRDELPEEPAQGGRPPEERVPAEMSRDGKWETVIKTIMDEKGPEWVAAHLEPEEAEEG